MTSQYAPTTWGQEPTHDLTVPSGQLCQVRLPGVQQMINAGVFESIDTLTGVVSEKHIKRVQGRSQKQGQPVEIDTNSLMKNPEDLAKVFEIVDKVTEHMVLQPKVKRPIRKAVDGKEVLLPFDEREDDVVYTDRIDAMDKMFIFQYAVGGDTDVESFRERFKQGMGSVAAI
jgi:hypothetical protein